MTMWTSTCSRSSTSCRAATSATPSRRPSAGAVAAWAQKCCLAAVLCCSIGNTIHSRLAATARGFSHAATPASQHPFPQAIAEVTVGANALELTCADDADVQLQGDSTHAERDAGGGAPVAGGPAARRQAAAARRPAHEGERRSGCRRRRQAFNWVPRPRTVQA